MKTNSKYKFKPPNIKHTPPELTHVSTDMLNINLQVNNTDDQEMIKANLAQFSNELGIQIFKKYGYSVLLTLHIDA